MLIPVLRTVNRLYSIRRRPYQSTYLAFVPLPSTLFCCWCCCVLVSILCRLVLTEHTFHAPMVFMSSQHFNTSGTISIATLINAIKLINKLLNIVYQHIRLSKLCSRSTLNRCPIIARCDSIIVKHEYRLDIINHISGECFSVRLRQQTK